MLFALILFLSLLCGYVLPWWAACIVAFAGAIFLGKASGHAFWSGFGGLALAWLAMALLKSFPNDHILAIRVAHLFKLTNWVQLLAITVIIGGIAGGMSAMSGYLVGRIFKKDEVTPKEA